MMTSEDIIVVENHPFRIMGLKGNSVYCTTSRSDSPGIPSDGGLHVKITFNIENVAQGAIHITQLCEYYKMVIVKDGENYEFNNNGQFYHDTFSPSMSHYKVLPIQSNSIENDGLTLTYFDCPYFKLEENWEKFEYAVKFKVYMQYNYGQFPDCIGQNLIPIEFFEWSLNGSFERDVNVGWSVHNTEISTEEEINQSINQIGEEESPIYPESYPNLKQTVEDFLDQNGL